MLFFAVLGALCTIGLFFITGPLYVLGGLLFILANVAFGASIVFYNAFSRRSLRKINAIKSRRAAGRWVTSAADCCCC